MDFPKPRIRSKEKEFIFACRQEDLSTLYRLAPSIDINCFHGKALRVIIENSLGPNSLDIFLSLLRDPKTDPNLHDWSGSTALHCAMRLNHYTAVKHLLLHPGLDVNKENADGDSPAKVAVNYCSVESLQLLLSDDRVRLEDLEGEWVVVADVVEAVWEEVREKHEVMKEIIENAKKSKREREICAFLKGIREESDINGNVNSVRNDNIKNGNVNSVKNGNVNSVRNNIPKNGNVKNAKIDNIKNGNVKSAKIDNIKNGKMKSKKIGDSHNKSNKVKLLDRKEKSSRSISDKDGSAWSSGREGKSMNNSAKTIKSNAAKITKTSSAKITKSSSAKITKSSAAKIIKSSAVKLPKGTVRCFICDCTLEVGELKDHLTFRHSTSSFDCADCPNKFKTMDIHKMGGHLKSQHGFLKSEADDYELLIKRGVILLPDDLTYVKCQLCKPNKVLVARDESLLRSHILLNHKEVSSEELKYVGDSETYFKFFCRICCYDQYDGENMTCLDSLLEHIHREHNYGKKVPHRNRSRNPSDVARGILREPRDTRGDSRSRLRELNYNEPKSSGESIYSKRKNNFSLFNQSDFSTPVAKKHRKELETSSQRKWNRLKSRDVDYRSENDHDKRHSNERSKNGHDVRPSSERYESYHDYRLSNDRSNNDYDEGPSDVRSKNYHDERPHRKQDSRDSNGEKSPGYSYNNPRISFESKDMERTSTCSTDSGKRDPPSISPSLNDYDARWSENCRRKNPRN